MTTLEQAIAAFLEHRQPRVRPRTIETYEFWLHRWLHWRQQHQCDPRLAAIALAELQRYFRAMESEGLKPASRDAFWRVLKALWRLLARRGMLSDEQLTFFGEDGLARVTVPNEIRIGYDDETIETLLVACKSTNREQEHRNRAIILLLWQSGARASEICDLTDEQTKLAHQRGVITGKGGRDRWLFWHRRAADELNQYLQYRRGPDGGPLLRSLRRNEALTPNAIRMVLKAAAKRAGVDLPERASIHGFRYAFADDALESGLADLDLQQLLGHASIVSTMRYTRKSPERLGRVHARMGESRAQS